MPTDSEFATLLGVSSSISRCFHMDFATDLSVTDEEFTLNAHQDSGAIERWEDPEYRACYREIFEGRWEEYDPWNADHRSDAKTDLYSTGGKLPPLMETCL